MQPSVQNGALDRNPLGVRQPILRGMPALRLAATCVAITTARAAATASTSEPTAAGSTISSRSMPSPWATSAAAAAALAALSQLWCDA